MHSPCVERPPGTPSTRRQGQIASQLQDSKYVPRIRQLMAASPFPVAMSACSPGCVSPGTLPGAAATQIPRPTSTSASARANASPPGIAFSIRIATPAAPIQNRLMTPSANSASIRPRQQPTQMAPCSMPIHRAPSTPVRPRIRKCSGERQCRRHADLSGVSWYRPAAASAPPATHGPCSSQARNDGLAARIAAVHGVRGEPVEGPGDQVPGDERDGLRVAARARRTETAGAADGSIMAAVIVTQMPRYQLERAEIGARAGVHPAHALERDDPCDHDRREQHDERAPAQCAGGVDRAP